MLFNFHFTSVILFYPNEPSLTGITTTTKQKQENEEMKAKISYKIGKESIKWSKVFTTWFDRT